MANKCCLKLSDDQECYGLVTKRNINDDLTIDCCEKHIIAYQELAFLAENGYNMDMLKRLNRAERLKIIDKVKKGKHNE